MTARASASDAMHVASAATVVEGVSGCFADSSEWLLAKVVEVVAADCTALAVVSMVFVAVRVDTVLVTAVAAYSLSVGKHRG